MQTEVGKSLHNARMANSKAHRVILEHRKKEATQHQDSPDEDVGYDTCWQVGSALPEHRCAIPEDGDVVPCKRRRYDGSMDDQGSRRVTEVKGEKVEEVDDQKQLALPEICSDPEHNEAKGHKVVLEYGLAVVHVLIHRECNIPR